MSVQSRKSARNKTPTKKLQPQDDEEMMDIDEDELRDAVMNLDNCLDDLRVVCSGQFETISREKLEEFVRQKGGTITTTVSGKTDYLIVGYKLEDGRDVTQGSKYQKAKTNGKTKILTESEFEEFIKERIGDPTFSLSQRK